MTLKLETAPIAGCRRSTDRRQARVLSLFYGLIKSRRRGDRRQFLTEPQYVDVHGPLTLVVVLAIMLLCVADSFFTLVLIGHGSRELNPFLAWILNTDVMLFYAVKYIMTAFCVYLVMMHKHFTILGMKGYQLLFGVLLCYIALISYQLSMLLQIPLQPL